MPSISVIVPIYNVEKYLVRCINSILSQTFSNFELILVDDGSTDNSGRICDEYSEKDSRVHVIHKTNGGVSSARNCGMNSANGNYVAFIDGDDFIVNTYLEKLYEHQGDLVICNACYATPDGLSIGKAYDIGDKGQETVSDKAILLWFEKGLMYSVWGRLFKSSIIKNNNLTFDINTTRGEDTIFMFQYIDYCKKVIFVSEELYYYVRYGLDGSSSSRLNRMNVIALDYLDNFLDKWFSERSVFSKEFYSTRFWTRVELKDYFLRIFNDDSLPIIEKYKWYKLFFSLKSFPKIIDSYFKKGKKKHFLFIRVKSPFLLTAYHLKNKALRSINDT